MESAAASVDQKVVQAMFEWSPNRRKRKGDPYAVQSDQRGVTHLKQQHKRLLHKESSLRRDYSIGRADLQETWDRLVTIRAHLSDHARDAERVKLDVIMAFSELSRWKDPQDSDLSALNASSAARLGELHSLRDKVRLREGLRSKVLFLEEQSFDLRKQLTILTEAMQIALHGHTQDNTYLEKYATVLNALGDISTQTQKLRNLLLSTGQESERVEQNLLDARRNLLRTEQEVTLHLSSPKIINYLYRTGDAPVVPNITKALPAYSLRLKETFSSDSELIDFISHGTAFSEEFTNAIKTNQLNSADWKLPLPAIDMVGRVSMQTPLNSSKQLSLHEVLSVPYKTLVRMNGEDDRAYLIRIEKRIFALSHLEKELKIQLERKLEAVKKVKDMIKDTELMRLRTELHLNQIEAAHEVYSVPKKRDVDSFSTFKHAQARYKRADFEKFSSEQKECSPYQEIGASLDDKIYNDEIQEGTSMGKNYEEDTPAELEIQWQTAMLSKDESNPSNSRSTSTAIPTNDYSEQYQRLFTYILASRVDPTSPLLRVDKMRTAMGITDSNADLNTRAVHLILKAILQLIEQNSQRSPGVAADYHHRYSSQISALKHLIRSTKFSLDEIGNEIIRKRMISLLINGQTDFEPSDITHDTLVAPPKTSTLYDSIRKSVAKTSNGSDINYLLSMESSKGSSGHYVDTATTERGGDKEIVIDSFVSASDNSLSIFEDSDNESHPNLFKFRMPSVSPCLNYRQKDRYVRQYDLLHPQETTKGSQTKIPRYKVSSALDLTAFSELSGIAQTTEFSSIMNLEKLSQQFDSNIPSRLQTHTRVSHLPSLAGSQIIPTIKKFKLPFDPKTTTVSAVENDLLDKERLDKMERRIQKSLSAAAATSSHRKRDTYRSNIPRISRQRSGAVVHVSEKSMIRSTHEGSSTEKDVGKNTQVATEPSKDSPDELLGGTGSLIDTSVFSRAQTIPIEKAEILSQSPTIAADLSQELSTVESKANVPSPRTASILETLRRQEAEIEELRKALVAMENIKENRQSARYREDSNLIDRIREVIVQGNAPLAEGHRETECTQDSEDDAVFTVLEGFLKDKKPHLDDQRLALAKGMNKKEKLQQKTGDLASEIDEESSPMQPRKTGSQFDLHDVYPALSTDTLSTAYSLPRHQTEQSNPLLVCRHTEHLNFGSFVVDLDNAASRDDQEAARHMISTPHTSTFDPKKSSICRTEVDRHAVEFLQSKINKYTFLYESSKRDEFLDILHSFAIDTDGKSLAKLEVMILSAKNVPVMKHLQRSTDTYIEFMLLALPTRMNAEESRHKLCSELCNLGVSDYPNILQKYPGVVNVNDCNRQMPSRNKSYHRTNTLRNSFFPEWREYFSLPIASVNFPLSSLHLLFIVKDAMSSHIDDLPIGYNLIPVQKILSNQEKHKICMKLIVPLNTNGQSRLVPKSFYDCEVKMELKLFFSQQIYYHKKLEEVKFLYNYIVSSPDNNRQGSREDAAAVVTHRIQQLMSRDSLYKTKILPNWNSPARKTSCKDVELESQLRSSHPVSTFVSRSGSSPMKHHVVDASRDLRVRGQQNNKLEQSVGLHRSQSSLSVADYITPNPAYTVQSLQSYQMTRYTRSTERLTTSAPQSSSRQLLGTGRMRDDRYLSIDSSTKSSLLGALHSITVDETEAVRHDRV